jgi:hypothetical protein
LAHRGVFLPFSTFKNFIVQNIRHALKLLFSQASMFGLQRQDYRWLLADTSINDCDLVAITKPDSPMITLQGFHPACTSASFFQNDVTYGQYAANPTCFSNVSH